MTVLDVLETVSRCGQVISCEQSHDQVCESDKLSAAISQVSTEYDIASGHYYYCSLVIFQILSKLIDNSE